MKKNEKLIVNALIKVAFVFQFTQNFTDIPKETLRPWQTMKLKQRESRALH